MNCLGEIIRFIEKKAHSRAPGVEGEVYPCPVKKLQSIDFP